MSTLTETSLEVIATKASSARDVLKNAEAEIVKATIKSVHYNQSKAAIALGISRGTMRKMLDTYFPGEYFKSAK